MSNDILFLQVPGQGGHIGRIILNRPQVLNAMTTAMCRQVWQQLQQWASDANIKAVVITGEGERAFCAGGDIRHFYENGRKNIAKSREFFWHEYRMNHAIFYFPKPYIALMHGITMGGGAGVAINGSHRIGSENFMFAMPETGIGLHPDIGAGYFFNECLGKTGYYLGLTGDKIGPDDALYVGILDETVQQRDFNPIIDALAETVFNDNAHVEVSRILQSFRVQPESSKLKDYRMLIERCFSAMTVGEIISKLKAQHNAWAEQACQELLQKSPVSLKLTLKKLHDCRSLNFDQCLQLDFRLTSRILEQHDFYEGIRAAIIDKDRRPKWQPSDLCEIDQSIKTYFEPLMTDELYFS